MLTNTLKILPMHQGEIFQINSSQSDEKYAFKEVSQVFQTL